MIDVKPKGRDISRNQTKTLLGIETFDWRWIRNVLSSRRNQTKTLLGIETNYKTLILLAPTSAAIKLKPY